MTALHAVPDPSPTVVALLRDNEVAVRQRDVLAGLLVEHLVAQRADRFGGVDALGAGEHQALIDDVREDVWGMTAGAVRAEELRRLGRGAR